MTKKPDCSAQPSKAGIGDQWGNLGAKKTAPKGRF